MPYKAAIDWDGTVRCGFTLTSWMEHLRRAEIICESALEKVNALFLRYESSLITHDQLAQSSANIYAESIKNKDCSLIFTQAEVFSKIDWPNLFMVSKKLIEHLANLPTEIVIISGAPIEVISQFKPALPISHIYGLRLKVKNKKYVGSVLENPGVSEMKKKILRRHFRKFPIRYAVGNSLSDLPLFCHAEKSVVVDNPELMPDTDVFHISSAASNSDLIKLIAFLGE